MPNFLLFPICANFFRISVVSIYMCVLYKKKKLSIHIKSIIQLKLNSISPFTFLFRLNLPDKCQNGKVNSAKKDDNGNDQDGHDVKEHGGAAHL